MKIDLRYLYETRTKYSTFEISSLMDAIIELCNIYDMEESFQKGQFGYNYVLNQDPIFSQDINIYDIYNKNNKNVKFTLFTDRNNKITFYCVNKAKCSISFSVQHILLNNQKNRFWDSIVPYYIINFINYLIDYRIENDLETISKEEVDQVLKEYLKYHLDTIREILIESEEKELKELHERSTARKRILEKIEN